jgi:hypothetical protein
MKLSAFLPRLEIPMKLKALLVAFALTTSFLAGCSGGDGEIAVDSASAPLTSAGNDKLFTLRIVEARDGGYPIDGLVVKATVDDKEPITITCVPTDTNANKALEKGEVLECTEAATNQLDSSVAGKEIEIALTAKIDGEDVTVGTASWTPKK